MNLMNYEMTKNKILSPPARVCVGGGGNKHLKPTNKLSITNL